MSVGAFLLVVLVVWLLCTGLVGLLLERARRGPRADLYPPEAAEAPDDGFERARPLTEVGPLVVAGSDLDLSEARVNLLFAVLTMPYASDAAEYERGVVGLYVAPEVDR